MTTVMDAAGTMVVEMQNMLDASKRAAARGDDEFAADRLGWLDSAARTFFFLVEVPEMQSGTLAAARQEHAVWAIDVFHTPLSPELEANLYGACMACKQSALCRQCDYWNRHIMDVARRHAGTLDAFTEAQA